jgi:hypothetical protein
MPLFGKETKEEAFWKWFSENQDDLYNFEKDLETKFDRLSEALKRVHPDLTFEFSPVRKGGKREFVISAGGIKAAFPSVETLHAAAPHLPKWTFVKFRPRRFPINDLEFEGRKVKAGEVHYALIKDKDPKKVGVILFFEAYPERGKDAILENIGYLFLDEALGEYDVETRVGAIVFLNRKSEYFPKAHVLSELPAQFDKEVRQRSGG